MLVWQFMNRSIEIPFKDMTQLGMCLISGQKSFTSSRPFPNNLVYTCNYSRVDIYMSFASSGHKHIYAHLNLQTLQTLIRDSFRIPLIRFEPALFLLQCIHSHKNLQNDLDNIYRHFEMDTLPTMKYFAIVPFPSIQNFQCLCKLSRPRSGSSCRCKSISVQKYP